MKPFRVLSVESSCDDSAVALLEGDRLLFHRIHTQKVHLDFGGIVPELAARDHIVNLPVLLRAMERETGIPIREVDALAVTAGPGLLGSLLVGTQIARSLAWLTQKPIVAVNHLEAHLWAHLLDPAPLERPYLGLLVSGGHTLYIRVDDLGVYHTLGQTLDDAAGEAFDKVAKYLNLGFPGGPLVERLAADVNPHRFKLPQAMRGRNDLSFSGLKTAAVLLADKLAAEPRKDWLCDLLASFQYAVVEMLAERVARILRRDHLKGFLVTGGVAANGPLRLRLKQICQEQGVRCVVPPPILCTDNAATVAALGAAWLLKGRRDALDFPVRPRWPLGTNPQVPQ